MNRKKAILIISWGGAALPWVIAFVAALFGIWTDDAKWIHTAFLLFGVAMLSFAPIFFFLVELLDED